MTHVERQPVDLELALHQWDGYRQVMHDHGWDTVEAPPADDCPDGVFIEDTMVVYANLAVITRPGAPARRKELPTAELAVRSFGYQLARVADPGTLDGGDVLKHGETVWVGVGARTNAEGVRQLADALGPLGATVIAVPITKVLHLKSAISALPDGTVLGHPATVDDPSLFAQYLEMPEPEGAHVVLLNHNKLLMATSAPRSAALLTQRGYQVSMVDIGEFEKLEGCVTCLSVRLRGAF